LRGGPYRTVTDIEGSYCIYTSGGSASDVQNNARSARNSNLDGTELVGDKIHPAYDDQSQIDTQRHQDGIQKGIRQGKMVSLIIKVSPPMSADVDSGMIIINPGMRARKLVLRQEVGVEQGSWC
jgi:hypothetical protein